MDSILGLVRHSGNDSLFKALEMSLLATLSGQPFHLHAEGLRGTGKTTIMRAVRRVLPRIRRVKGCLYNCDPAAPHCPQHRYLSAERVSQLGEEWVPMPFLEISHSAKVGTVVGSVDLGRLVSPTQPEAALLPGTIPQAHRGIIFVDEINRLAETAPELADVLLDVMGTKPGRVQIEETGLPAVELPVQVSVWAASNPDEDPGPLEEIRRQLSDRFDLAVYTDRPGEAATVDQILAATDGPAWHRPLSPADETHAELFRAHLATRVPALRATAVPGPVRQHIAELYSRYNLESLRAVQAMQIGMRLVACLDARAEAGLEDLAMVVAMALRHRVDPETVKKIVTHLASLNPKEEAAPGAPSFGKNRYPTISFGGMTHAESLPAPPPESGANQGSPTAGRPVDKPDKWSTQYPPRPQAATAEDAAPSWLHRTLSGLRRNLGMTGTGATGRDGGKSSGRETTAPQPGRLFQRVETGVQNSEGGAQTRAQRQSGQAPVQRPDPLTTPQVAPPNRAKPLAELKDHELIRTEEELGRR